MTKIKLLILVTVVTLFSTSCKKELDSLSPQPRGKLIEAVVKGKMSRAQIVDAVDELSAESSAVYDVTLYSVTYRTETNGRQVDTKGLLLIPDNVSKIYLISYFHGTQLPVNLLDVYNPDNETPSNYAGGKDHFREIRNMGLTWASAGFTVFMPDYVGFGLSKDYEHPYMYYPEMFKANIDGLLAVKAFFASKNISYDNRLFLGGWSQGGGACLSAHKYIQTEYSSEFTVVASSSLAGPHNFAKFVDEILNKKDKDLNIYNIFSWAMYALNKYSTLKRPTDQLYAYPVYDQTSSIFPPSKKPAEIFNDYFLSKIIDHSDAAFRSEMNKNTFAQGWKPVGKVFLHHGDADDVVYYFNSVDARDGLTTAGGDVTLYTYPGGKHDTELGNYISKTLTDFTLLK